MHYNVGFMINESVSAVGIIYPSVHLSVQPPIRPFVGYAFYEKKTPEFESLTFRLHYQLIKALK